MAAGTMKVTTDNFTVEIFNDRPERGYFEHNEIGDECGGGLWFEGKNLIDYDGVFELPTDVIWAVRKLGFYVGKEFE